MSIKNCYIILWRVLLSENAHPLFGREANGANLRGGGGSKTFALFYICSPQKFIYYIVAPGRKFFKFATGKRVQKFSNQSI